MRRMLDPADGQETRGGLAVCPPLDDPRLGLFPGVVTLCGARVGSLFPAPADGVGPRQVRAAVDAYLA